MSIENEWRAELRRKIKSRMSLDDIIIRTIISEPKTIYEIKKAISDHRTKLPSTRQLDNFLMNHPNIVKFESMISPNEFSKCVGGGATPIKYGLFERLISDLESDSEDITYINRSTYFHLNKSGIHSYQTV